MNDLFVQADIFSAPEPLTEVSFKKSNKSLDKEDALHCANIFTDYFRKFGRIDEYMRDQKVTAMETVESSLPGMTIESLFFDKFSISPQDMEFEVVDMNSQPNAWNKCLNMISSHTNMDSIPGKSLRFGVLEKKTNQWIGFIRFGSPVINCKPRNELLGAVPDLTHFNKTTIMGFVIVPTQPFGFNYLGGKLLAGICCSHYIREMVNEKYDMNLVMFETTSLYGSSKTASQYDGMRPFLRYKGLTESDFIPLIHGKSFKDLENYVISKVGYLIKPDASSRKLKLTNLIIGLIKRSLEGEDLVKFNETIVNAKKLTEKKRYYVSNYGVENFLDIVNGKTTEIKKAENWDRYNLDTILEWWTKKATKRYDNLMSDNRLRKDLEVWTQENDIDIIR